MSGASRAGQRVVYQNDLPPLPSDCILPKFEVPRLDTGFSLESRIFKNATHSFVTDALLGVPVEFADLSVYSRPQTEEDITENDLKYMPELADFAQNRSLVVPTAQHIARLGRSSEDLARTKGSRDSQKTPNFLRSPFFDGPEDPAIEEQLKSAFHGKVPEGRWHPIREARPLMALMVRGAQGLDTKKTLLLSSKQNFLKAIPVVPEEGKEYFRAKTAYQVSVETALKVRAYWFVDQDEGYNMGRIDKRLMLKPMAPREVKEEEMTATPVIWVDDMKTDDRDRE